MQVLIAGGEALLCPPAININPYAFAFARSSAYTGLRSDAGKPSVPGTDRPVYTSSMYKVRQSISNLRSVF